MGPYTTSVQFLSRRVFGGLVVAAPMAVLAVEAARYQSVPLAIGVGLLGLATLLFARPILRERRAPIAIVIEYLIALTWCWLFTYQQTDPLAAAMRGGLLLCCVALFAWFDLNRTGAEPRRKSNRFARKLQNRSVWPRSAEAFQHLPEVRALQEVSVSEPGPIFALFEHDKAEVRAAAFAALTDRVGWRPREVAALLAAVNRTQEPAVRMLGATALATIPQSAAAAGLTNFFRDPIPDVRYAVVFTALGPKGPEWVFIRDAVRAYLTDARFLDERGLPGSIGRLPPIAVCDLTTWASEPEPLGTRATQVLIDHYAHALQTKHDYDLITSLTQQAIDPSMPPALRVELATLLRNLGFLTHELLDRMTNIDQPSPVRLLAAEALLAANPNDPDGIDVLRGLGRQQNREMSLLVAQIVQFRLGINIGWPMHGTVPTPRQSADIAKKVMQWASGRPTPVALTPADTTPGPSQAPLASIPPPATNLIGPPLAHLPGVLAHDSVPNLPSPNKLQPGKRPR